MNKSRLAPDFGKTRQTVVEKNFYWLCLLFLIEIELSICTKLMVIRSLPLRPTALAQTENSFVQWFLTVCANGFNVFS